MSGTAAPSLSDTAAFSLFDVPMPLSSGTAAAMLSAVFSSGDVFYLILSMCLLISSAVSDGP